MAALGRTWHHGIALTHRGQTGRVRVTIRCCTCSICGLGTWHRSTADTHGPTLRAKPWSLDTPKYQSDEKQVEQSKGRNCFWLLGDIEHKVQNEKAPSMCIIPGRALDGLKQGGIYECTWDKAHKNHAHKILWSHRVCLSLLQSPSSWHVTAVLKRLKFGFIWINSVKQYVMRYQSYFAYWPYFLPKTSFCGFQTGPSKTLMWHLLHHLLLAQVRLNLMPRIIQRKNALQSSETRNPSNWCCTLPLKRTHLCGTCLKIHMTMLTPPQPFGKTHMKDLSCQEHVWEILQLRG